MAASQGRVWLQHGWPLYGSSSTTYIAWLIAAFQPLTFCNVSCPVWHCSAGLLFTASQRTARHWLPCSAVQCSAQCSAQHPPGCPHKTPCQSHSSRLGWRSFRPPVESSLFSCLFGTFSTIIQSKTWRFCCFKKTHPQPHQYFSTTPLNRFLSLNTFAEDRNLILLFGICKSLSLVYS